jgi:hypothetical protein
MNLALINKNYEITLGNKRYPVPEESGPTPFFEEMTSSLIGELSLKSPKSDEMYPAFGSLVERFNRTFEQIKAFLVMIHRTNCTGKDHAAIEEKVKAVGTQMKKLTFSHPPGLTAQLAIRPEEEQLVSLNESISLNIRALVYFLTKSLDEMVAAQHVGLIDWIGPKVCSFHFFLNSFDTKDTILNRSHTVNDRTHTETWERETVKTAKRQRHQHDLVKAEALPVDTYVPFRVQKLAREVPDLFKDYFRVVQGQQIFEHVVEEVQTTVNRQGESRTWTEPIPQPARSVWKYDPALVIGDYVVAGWDEVEVAKSKRIDEWDGKRYLTGLNQRRSDGVLEFIHEYGLEKAGHFLNMVHNCSHMNDDEAVLEYACSKTGVR